MQNEEDFNEQLTPAEQELESALGGLKAARPTSIDRDRMLFCAGAASARRSLRIWRVAAAVLVGALGISLAARSNEPHIVRDVVYMNPSPASAVTERAAPTPRVEFTNIPDAADEGTPRDAALSHGSGRNSSYLVMRDRALRWGVAAALPETPTARRSAAHERDLEIIDTPLGRHRTSAPAKPSLQNLFFPGAQL